MSTVTGIINSYLSNRRIPYVVHTTKDKNTTRNEIITPSSIGFQELEVKYSECYVRVEPGYDDEKLYLCGRDFGNEVYVSLDNTYIDEITVEDPNLYG